MIMRPGQPLLLPVKPWFIWFTALLALTLDMLLNMALFGRAAWAPDVLALVLLFWVVHEPLRFNVGSAFFFGLLLDVHQGALLGQHALAYAVMAYMATRIHRRLLWFDLINQAVQVLPLLATMHALQWLVRLLAGNGWAGWMSLLAPVIETLLWPVVSFVLLAPQRRAHEPDENRPL